MAKLRNRVRKAEYFTDGELLRWPRDKRQTYTGLWAMAEDSGCLEADAFEIKCSIWASPLDSDITVDLIEQWISEMIETKKLIPYECDGKRYLFIRTFHAHEHPRNPQAPQLPLPPWITWQSNERDPRKGSYTVEIPTGSNGKVSRSTKVAVREPAGDDDDFDLFWEMYPRGEGKKNARTAWRHVKKADRRLAIGIAVIMSRLVSEGVQNKRFVPHATTFLHGERWNDWEDGVPADWEDVPAAVKRHIKHDIKQAIDDVYGERDEGDEQEAG